MRERQVENLLKMRLSRLQDGKVRSGNTRLRSLAFVMDGLPEQMIQGLKCPIWMYWRFGPDVVRLLLII